MDQKAQDPLCRTNPVRPSLTADEPTGRHEPCLECMPGLDSLVWVCGAAASAVWWPGSAPVQGPAQFPAMADPLLQGRYPMRGLYQALAVAAMCLQEQASQRPMIHDVVTALSYLAAQHFDPNARRSRKGATCDRPLKPIVLSRLGLPPILRCMDGNPAAEGNPAVGTYPARSETKEGLLGAGSGYQVIP